MGKFIAHVNIGAYLAMLAYWWSYNVLRDFFRSIGHTSSVTGAREKIPPFRSRVWYPGSICQRFPLEIAAKILISVIYILSELIYSATYLSVITMHHSVIVMCFTIDGAVELMVHYKWPLPKHSDSASTIIMAIIDMVVFISHQNGKTIIGQALHTYVIWTLGAVALLTALQTLYRSNAILPLIRALVTQLLSTWLVQIAFIDEPPFNLDIFHWKEKTEADQSMLIGFLFTSHCLLNMVVLFFFGLFVFYRTKPLSEPTNLLLTDNKISTEDDAESLLSLQPGSDSQSKYSMITYS